MSLVCACVCVCIHSIVELGFKIHPQNGAINSNRVVSLSLKEENSLLKPSQDIFWLLHEGSNYEYNPKAFVPLQADCGSKLGHNRIQCGSRLNYTAK